MEQNLQDIFVFSLTIKEAIGNILVSLLCGVFIALLYRITYKGVSYSVTFTNAIIMLTMITTLVIMVIGNNLARAFGLVGAMSIIRFRTAVKDSQDIMFIFFALGIGLSAGVGVYAVTFTSTILIGLAIFITTRINHANPLKREYLLQILADSKDIPNSDFERSLTKYCSVNKLVNIKAINKSDKEIFEISYYIKFKKESKGNLLVSEIKQIPNIKQVNLFFDED